MRGDWEHNQRYRRTPKGCLMRAYEYAQRRLRAAEQRHARYAGLTICTRKEWYKAFLTDSEFIRLHAEWIAADCDKWARPTPDRQDTSIGYVVSNIRWERYDANTLRAIGVGEHEVHYV